MDVEGWNIVDGQAIRPIASRDFAYLKIAQAWEISLLCSGFPWRRGQAPFPWRSSTDPGVLRGKPPQSCRQLNQPWTAAQLNPPGAASGDLQGFPSSSMQSRRELAELSAANTAFIKLKKTPCSQQHKGREAFSNAKPEGHQLFNVAAPRSEGKRK